MRDQTVSPPPTDTESTTPARPTPGDSVHRLNQALALEREALNEILQENRRMRRMTLELLRSLRSLAGESKPPTASSSSPVETGWAQDVATVEARLAIYQRKLEKATQRHVLLRNENSSLVGRCQELMKENNNLFKLYVASHHLHASLDLNEVMKTLSEIVVDIIGASDHAIFLFDPRSRELVPAAMRGLEGRRPERVPLGEGPIGSVVASGEGCVVHDPPGDRSISPDRPLVVIVLRVQERLVGAIAIYGLLSHKPGFSDVDYALFDFFAAHAAAAIHSARLYAGSEAKVTKMKEFMTLMKPVAGSKG
jgi:hypothetical protein